MSTKKFLLNIGGGGSNGGLVDFGTHDARSRDDGPKLFSLTRSWDRLSWGYPYWNAAVGKRLWSRREWLMDLRHRCRRW